MEGGWKEVEKRLVGGWWKVERRLEVDWKYVGDSL